jgi:Rrf2 family nitric oxide-sensitive transcriptional repressor
MQLAAFTDYGLRCLMYLAAHDERQCTVREISGYFGISHHHLVKVVHRLGQHGFITTKKGKGGGIRLAGPASAYKLGDVAQALEPDMEMAECFNAKKNTCRLSGGCGLKHAIAEASRSFIGIMNEYTLAEVVKNKSLFFDASPPFKKNIRT